MNNQIVRWGIIGSGRIANVREGLIRRMEDFVLLLPGISKRQSFAKEWNIPYAFEPMRN